MTDNVLHFPAEAARNDRLWEKIERDMVADGMNPGMADSIAKNARRRLALCEKDVIFNYRADMSATELAAEIKRLLMAVTTPVMFQLVAMEAELYLARRAGRCEQR